MCVYMWVSVYVYVCVCVHVCGCMGVWVGVHVGGCMGVCVWVGVYKYRYKCGVCTILYVGERLGYTRRLKHIVP